MKHVTQGFMQGALALVLVGGFFGVLMIVISKPDMRDSLLIMIGNLSGALMAVVGFYYGSTKGSQAKDKLLAESQPITPMEPKNGD